jgi:hypothetical protein
MSASNDGVPSRPSPAGAPVWGDAPRDGSTSAPLGRGGPDREPAIGLMSDRSLRGMIEIWFEVEKMKSNHVLVPDFADRLRKCEQRIHGAIMRLANEAALSRNGESGAVALWLEAVARGKAETVSALAELRSKMT